MINQPCYNVDHLTTGEIWEIADAVRTHREDVLSGTADKNDILYADPDELYQEFLFWFKELGHRIDPLRQK